MKSRRTIEANFWLLLALLSGAWPALMAAQVPSAELRALASKANSKSAWAPLLRFAESAKDPEEQGLAYFVLGYREFDADSYEFAISNFKKAAEIDFSLADYAQYYLAAAAQEANRPNDVLEALAGFNARFPESSLRQNALELYARTLLDTNQARRAVEVLKGGPRLRVEPSLTLLLANAYRQMGKAQEAARTYQDIYYTFSTSSQARVAGDALDVLRVQLGESFPQVTEATEMARAEKLFGRSYYQQALDAYKALLRDHSASSLAPQWKVGSARCLYRLRQTSQALDALQETIRDNPAADAERLSALVDIYARQDDSDSMDLILNQLSRLYPTSLSYASALDSAGDYYVRRADWSRAAHSYEPLAGQFPDSTWGQEANWRLAWSYYLTKNTTRARQAFLNHLRRYPDSRHAAGALYWLANLAEEDGAPDVAQTLDKALVKRFGQSYYAVRARRRLAELSKKRFADNTARAAAWSQVAALAGQLPPLGPPPVSPCAPAQTTKELARFRTLAALSLDDLAEASLRAAVSDHPDQPELLLALSQFETGQGKIAPGVLDAVRAVKNYSEFEFNALPKQVWDLLYPRAYWDLVQSEAAARGIDPYLVMGLIRQESAFNPDAVSVANARGLMQILPKTVANRRSRRRAAARQLMNPDYNVRAGTDLLGRLSATFDGNMEQVLAAYHAGESRVIFWRGKFSFRDPAEFLETIPIPSTRLYVERVLRDANVYRAFLTSSAAFADCHLPRAQTEGAGPADSVQKPPAADRAGAPQGKNTASSSPSPTT